jgi:hypothetical protein
VRKNTVIEKVARWNMRNMRRDGMVKRKFYLYSRSGEPIGTVTVDRGTFDPYTGKYTAE